MTSAPMPLAPWWSRTQFGLVVLAAMAVGLFFFFHIPVVAHTWTYWTGQDNESGGKYGGWSGFWGAIQPTLIATGLIVYWHWTCHLPGCWLPGRHQLAGGVGRACRFHHPDIRGRKMTQELMHELHNLHLDRLAGTRQRSQP
jgi:hypothetical protein